MSTHVIIIYLIGCVFAYGITFHGGQVTWVGTPEQRVERRHISITLASVGALLSWAQVVGMSLADGLWGDPVGLMYSFHTADELREKRDNGFYLFYRHKDLYD